MPKLLQPATHDNMGSGKKLKTKKGQKNVDETDQNSSKDSTEDANPVHSRLYSKRKTFQTIDRFFVN